MIPFTISSLDDKKIAMHKKSTELSAYYPQGVWRNLSTE